MTSLWITLTLLHGPAFAEGTHSASESETEVVERRVCKRDSDQRILDVFPVQKGCTLEYVKDGKAEVKAKSVRGVEVCREALQKIRSKLEKSGFHCE